MSYSIKNCTQCRKTFPLKGCRYCPDSVHKDNDGYEIIPGTSQTAINYIHFLLNHHERSWNNLAASGWGEFIQHIKK